MKSEGDVRILRKKVVNLRIILPVSNPCADGEIYITALIGMKMKLS